jgi:AAA15 family ATPase/GTPase
MIIQSLSVKNFRCVEDIELKEFRRVNVILGNNNVGKTTLLESIFLLTGMSNSILLLTIDSFRGLTHNNSEDFRFFFRGLDYNNKPEITGTLFNKNIRSLKITPELRIPGGSKIVSTSGTNLSSDNSVIADSLALEFSLKAPHSREEKHKATLRFDNGAFEPVLPKSYKEKLYGIFIGSGYHQSPDLHKRLDTLITEKRKDEIIPGLQLLNPKIKDISLGTGGVINLDVEGISRLIPSNLFGSGTNRLISFLINISSIKNGVCMLDEIENGFHFSVMPSIWKLLIKASQLYNVQLFVSTHNVEILKALSNCVAKNDSLFNEQEDNLVVYKLFTDKNNKLNSSRFSSSQFQHAIESDVEIR